MLRVLKSHRRLQAQVQSISSRTDRRFSTRLPLQIPSYARLNVSVRTSTSLILLFRCLLGPISSDKILCIRLRVTVVELLLCLSLDRLFGYPDLDVRLVATKALLSLCRFNVRVDAVSRHCN